MKGSRKKSQRKRERGFTIIELLVGSTVMMIIILGTLSLYMKSNRISVDHQQFAELQHDVRSSMFFITRDIRSTGVGLTEDIAGYFLEGLDGFGPDPEVSDTLKVMGNFDDPLDLRVRQYQGGVGGGAATVFFHDWELENTAYDCPEYFEDKIYILISTTCPGCYSIRNIPLNSLFGCGSGTAHANTQPGQSGLNPPGGLVDTGCSADCYDDSIITFVQIKQYWLDTTGNPGDYPSLNVQVGQDGYMGIPNTLYLTTMEGDGSLIHMPFAQNIENLQLQYNMIDTSGNFLGFADWSDSWTKDDISRIRQIRIWILGRTPNAFVSVGGKVASNLHLYRRPAVANSPLGDTDDMRRRFLLETTANIRNLSLNIYNTGSR